MVRVLMISLRISFRTGNGRQRQGLLTLPAELMTAVPVEDGPIEPAFVPLAITMESKTATDALPVPEPVEITSGIVTVEIGPDLVMRGSRRCTG